MGKLVASLAARAKVVLVTAYTRYRFGKLEWIDLSKRVCDRKQWEHPELYRHAQVGL